MIVIYENSKMKWRDITVFDGHAYVIGGNASHDLSVSGFNTVQSGPVNMKLGLMAGEGDVGITGDYFKIINQQNNWVSLNHTGNSATNFSMALLLQVEIAELQISKTTQVLIFVCLTYLIPTIA